MKKSPRRFFRDGVRWILSPLRNAGLHILRLNSPRRRVNGIELVDLTPSRALTETFFGRVGEALELLEQRVPAVSVGIRGRLKRIALLAGGGEFYHRGLRAYVIDMPSFQRRNTTEIALAIVHESTHARVENRGVRYNSEERERIERICGKAELAVAEKLGLSEVLISGIRDKFSKRWWTEHSLHKRRLHQLREHRVPEWAIRIYEWFFAP